MQLVKPSLQHIDSYVQALARGWSPNNMRAAQAQEELDTIKADPDAFLASLDSTQVAGEPVTMPDGSQVPRLPGFRRWMWDGEFCGSLGFRWQRGTHELPPYCLGHIGYTVVPWKRRLGYATQALQQFLPEARALGLPYVELAVAHDNAISKHVIEKCGGMFVEEFPLPACYGEGREWRYRIELIEAAR
jgi:predicted acetyltransferase